MAEDQRTFGERVSDGVARFGGSWRFIILGFVAIVSWATINTLEFFHIIHFDPYPFILLNLFLSMVAAFQAPFIMMSQNRTERKQDEAYRALFGEIKELVQQDIDIENQLVDMLKVLTARLDKLENKIEEE